MPDAIPELFCRRCFRGDSFCRTPFLGCHDEDSLLARSHLQHETFREKLVSYGSDTYHDTKHTVGRRWQESR
jgi:hypothetical protein